jgi:hypothetical protein
MATFNCASSVDAPRCGRGDDLIQFDERMIGAGRFVDVHVESRPGDFAGLDRVGQILLVDDAAARAVDNAHAGLHLSESRLID